MRSQSISFIKEAGGLPQAGAVRTAGFGRKTAKRRVEGPDGGGTAGSFPSMRRKIWQIPQKIFQKLLKLAIEPGIMYHVRP